MLFDNFLTTLQMKIYITVLITNGIMKTENSEAMFDGMTRFFRVALDEA